MGLKPTLQQQALIEGIAFGEGNKAGQARAGSAKTTTLEMSGPVVPEDKSVIACAFNRDIAKVMAERLPAHWLSKTTHSLAYGAVRKRLNRKLELNDRKTFEIMKEIPESDEFPDLRRAVGIAKAWGIVPKGALAEPRSMAPDEPATYNDLFDRYDLDVGYHPDPIGVLRQILLVSASRAWQGEIDFDDMLWLAYIYKAALPQADLVLVDEAQDIAPIQRGLLRMMMKPEGRLVAIGDDRQAIYGFRGADKLSLPKIIEEFDCEVLPLTTCFRCAQSVVLEAQKDVPDIEPWDQSPVGSVTDLDSLRFESVPRHAAILCRNNAPIIQAALGFIKRGIGARVLGREIANGLKTLIDKQKATELGELSSRMWEDVSHRARLLENRGKESQAALLKDKAEAIECLIAFVGRQGTVRGLKAQIDSMFSDKTGVVTLSTIHKAKGLEWDTVFILDPQLIPSKWAKSDEDKQQEYNLRYVARTRAKQDLYYIRSEDMK